MCKVFPTTISVALMSGAAFCGLPHDVSQIVLQGQYAGHLQDVWYDGNDYLYWAHTLDLLKTDLSGRIVQHARVEGHHAGIEVRDGRVYVAVCPMQSVTNGDTTPDCRVTINEYDADTLKLLKRNVTDINDRSGSLAILEDGTFLVGCLRPQDIKPTQVRFHHLDRDYRLIRSYVLDDVPVRLGIEVIKVGKDGIYLCMYNFDNKLPYDCIKLDFSFKEVWRGKLSGACGLVFDGEDCWCGVADNYGDGTGPASCSGRLIRTPGARMSGEAGLPRARLKRPVELASAEEVHAREGVGNFMAKLESGHSVTVAYLGGSITEMSGWRNMTTDWLRKTWPKAKVTEVPAAIGGTGSDLGVFRLWHDALAMNPDLLFVEFATNDADMSAESIWQNFDGIVQQTWSRNPKTDIVFVYTITSSMMKDYGSGKMNHAASAMEKVAAHYGVPSVCFGPRVAAEVKAGRVVMSMGEVATAVPKETPDRDRLINEELKKKGLILFAKDGVHPALPGHAFYLQSIVAAFEQMRTLPPTDHAGFLGKPFFDGQLVAARMVPINASMLKGEGWTRLPPDTHEQESFGGRGGQFYRADRPGAKLTFRFCGTRCGIYDLLAPNGANVRVTVDGKVTCKACPRFDLYCWYTRLATMPIYEGREGVHNVEVEVLEMQPDRTQVKHENTNTSKYNGTCFQPCQIMLVGEM